MEFDVQAIKKSLTLDNILEIMAALGVEPVTETPQYLIFPSCCHHKTDWYEHKPKLYCYINDDGFAFHCFSCGGNWDIISLVKQCRDTDFATTVQWICEACHLSLMFIRQESEVKIDDWQSLIRDLGRMDETVKPTVNYDTAVLKLFSKAPHQSWLDDGITESAMQKFGIGWYGRTGQITIPVYDERGSLVGIHGRNTREWMIENGLKYTPVKTLNEQYKFPTNAVLYGLWQNADAIRRTKSAWIFEAPKSVLQCESIMGNNNAAVSLFGMNLNRHRAKMLTDMGVERIYICLDRQYVEWRDEECRIWAEKCKKISALFQGLVSEVWCICDTAHRLPYKASPSDMGKDVLIELWKERILLSK